jgi:hypothetical protein
VSVSNSTASNNTSNGYAGGGLAVAGNGTVELVNGTVLLRNSAVNSSGGGHGVVLLNNGTLCADDSVAFANTSVGKGYVGSTIAAFATSTLDLPHGGRLTKCSVGVYLGWSTCQVGETQQHDMCVLPTTHVQLHQCHMRSMPSQWQLLRREPRATFAWLLVLSPNLCSDAPLPAVHDSMQLHQPYSCVQ